MAKPFFYPNRLLQLKKGLINIYQHLQNTSARNNSIKMALIIFASLYQAKEGLIFYVHFFYRRTFYLRGSVEVVLPSFHINKASAAKNSEVFVDALRGHSAPQGRIRWIRGFFHLTATSRGRFTPFFHHIDMHKRSF